MALWLLFGNRKIWAGQPGAVDAPAQLEPAVRKLSEVGHERLYTIFEDVLLQRIDFSRFNFWRMLPSEWQRR